MAQHNVSCGSGIADTNSYAVKIPKYACLCKMDCFFPKEDAVIEVAKGLKTWASVSGF